MTSKIYTPKAAAEAVGCSPDTIRRYCAEYGRHLSEGAKPGHGEARVMTAVDVYLLQLIKREVDRKTPSSDIHKLLESVAIPESLLADDDPGEALTRATDSTSNVAVFDSPDVVALVRQITSSLAAVEGQDRRIGQVETDVGELRRVVDTLRDLVNGQPDRPKPPAIPPAYIVLSVALVALAAMSIAAFYFSQ